MEQLIKEFVQITQYIKQAEERAKEIKAQLAQAATFKEGSKTGHLTGGGYNVKVVLRDNVKWDQSKIPVIFEGIPTAKELFKIEYKPDNKKLEAAMARSEDLEKAVKWARTVTPGSPTITYEIIEEKF